ncbi:hypothetical protein [Pseudomonas sp. NPDC096950]|uniref:hypothetical protein n=1 Tax=Pseudomonas sp. NPDC096950 TaxID=3364485 RepID=UPI00383A5DCD
MNISGKKVVLKGDFLSPELEQELQALRAESKVFATIVDVCFAAGFRGDTSVLDFIQSKLKPVAPIEPTR